MLPRCFPSVTGVVSEASQVHGGEGTGKVPL